jgi:UDP-N-acetylglucosamine--N-acetylmuramyl-(pentapeptide) pyrophosphoryl-undecaprenol N-acetylglucosamine transferase
MDKLKKVLIMAGGTGGHVFPGLAIAKTLQAQGIAVEWLGTQKGLEAKLVPAAQIPLHCIAIAGVRGKGWLSLVAAPWRLVAAIRQARDLIKNLKPDVVIGLGGFASGPGGIAAWLLKLPLIIHEQNAKPGLTNQWLAKLATKALQAFPEAFAAKYQALTVGNPLRAEIIALPAPCEKYMGDNSLHNRPLNLLVLGGSLGAAALNLAMPTALAAINANYRPNIWHQTGEKHWQQTVVAYENANVVAQVTPFFTDIAKAYAWADLVICRAGALTISELCAAGLGAILVPYPYAVDDHQTANAQFMVQHQAAVLIQQADLTIESLVPLLKSIIAEPSRCQTMAEAAYALRITTADQKVLMTCQEICR